MIPTTMFNKQTIVGQEGKMIQFHGIKTIYPVNERIPCVFTIPEVCQPECGDWIGIYPVGWTSIVRDCVVRQMVPVERFVAGQVCQVEFESLFGQEHKFLPHQQYQFVYVNNNGEYTILGKSMPFRFTPIEEQLYEKETTIIPGMPITGEWTGIYNKYGRMPVVVETEMQKLEKDLIQFEQQGWTGLFGGEKIVTPFEWTQTTKMQPIRLVKSVEQLLKEKIRVEQAQRRIEQLCVLAQLKSFERHIACVQKREAEIRDYLLRAKIQSKIAAFEQKVQQVLREKYTVGVPQMSTPVEQYVRKYEQLLREKIQLDMEKRRIVLHKLRMNVRECERRLRELQTIDQEHLVSFHQLLKSKIEQFAQMRMYNEICTVGQEWNKHFEGVMGSFLLEQEKVQLNLAQVQRELVYMVNEICSKLQEHEIVECYSTLRIPRVIPSLMFQSHPKLMQIVQLERKIAEQKLKLKLRMLQQAGLLNTGVFGGRFVEQLTRGIWFTPVIEKLRMIQYHLAKIQQQQLRIVQVEKRQFWIEKKLQLVAELVQKLTQFQTEVLCHTSVFDQIKLRQVLVQLQQLRERECIEIPRMFQQETSFLYNNTTTIVELCQHLGELVGEKCGELVQYMQCFQPQFVQMQQQMPFECLLATLGCQYGPEQYKYGPAMLELFEIERKLVEMKGLTLATVQYMHLNERLVELEHIARIGGQHYWTGNEQCQLIGKRAQEKLRLLKSLIAEHIILNNGEYYPQPILPTTFLTVPEHFYQHQHKYEKLCQLFNEIECHFVELPIIPTTTTTPVEYETIIPTPIVAGEYLPTSVFGGEYNTIIPGGKYNKYFGGLYTPYEKIHRFLRLVQEFQMQFPECFAPKCEEIVSFLRQWTVEKKELSIVRGIEQLLREKLVEFETILCHPECEIACLTTVVYPQSTTGTFKTQRECLKQLIRQVRELKSQLYLVGQQQQQQQWTTPFVQPTTIVNNTPVTGTWYPIEQQQQQLVDLWNKKMWNVERPTTIVETTTTTNTVGQQQKTITTTQVPTTTINGLVRPITIEKINTTPLCVEETIIPTFVEKINKRFPSQFELVGEECDFFGEEEINNNNEWEQIEFVEPSSIESCLCQMEKYMRKYNKNGLLVECNEVCPICTVVPVVEKFTGVRRF